MALPNALVAPEKKPVPFYVLKRSSGGHPYREGAQFYGKTPAAAKRFQSIADALTFIEQNGRTGDALSIVRVEEITETTPETRIVLEENLQVILKDGESIKYALRTSGPKYGQTFIGAGTYSFLSLLPAATLWNSQAQALEALQYAVKGRTNIVTSEGAVVRVLVKAGATVTKFIETVLS